MAVSTVSATLVADVGGLKAYFTSSITKLVEYQQELLLDIYTYLIALPRLSVSFTLVL